MMSFSSLVLVLLGIGITVVSLDVIRNKEISKYKREATPVYYVNLLLYIDYTVYNRFYVRTMGSNNTTREVETESEIKKYYILYAQTVPCGSFLPAGPWPNLLALILPGLSYPFRARWNGTMNEDDSFKMNDIYSNINSSRLQIKISLVDIIISEERETWIDLKRGVLNTGTILDNFYSQLTHYNITYIYGHAMLITENRISSNINETIAGRAEFNSICREDKKSVSVVVDQGGFQSVRTACHELAHSLGVRHDSGPGCHESENYIMAMSARNTANADLDIKLNRWRFSRCSVKAMEDTVDTIMSLSPQEQRCLTKKLPSNVDQTSVENRQPGQVYTPDQQCQMIRGTDFYFYRDGTQASNICTNMKCKINDTHYIAYPAAEGTSCGNEKWCRLGNCVYAEEAPDKPENCVFGDRPAKFKYSIKINRPNGSVEEMKVDCSEIAKSLPYLCYTADVSLQCCSSCGEIATSITGCEYGDKIQNCLKSNCDQVYPDGYVPARRCCGTCNLQSPFVCQDQDAGCDSEATGGATRCYDVKFAFRCCKTCERARDLNRTGCEYGDRDTQCDVLTHGGTANCDVYKKQCCKSCYQEVTSSGHKATFALSHWFLFLMLVVFHLSHHDLLK